MEYLIIAVLAMCLVAGAGLFFGRLFMEGDSDADEARRLGVEAAEAERKMNSQNDKKSN